MRCIDHTRAWQRLRRHYGGAPTAGKPGLLGRLLGALRGRSVAVELRQQLVALRTRLLALEVDLAIERERRERAERDKLQYLATMTSVPRPRGRA